MVDLGPTDRLTASHEELRAIALEIDEIGDRLLRGSARLALAAAGVSATASLSPATAIAAQAAIGIATIGPSGLAANGLALSGTADALRTALRLLAGIDQGLRFATPALESLAGATARGWLPTPTGAGIRDLLGAYAGQPSAPILTPLTPSAPLTSGPAPQTLADLIRRLHQTSAGPAGSIAIQSILGSDGAPRHIVYLPGTDSIDRSATRSWASNAGIRLGHPTTYQAGVMAAMTAAGVRPGEPVMLVGHSQGGMVAAEIARSPDPFTITQVVTAGSPIGDRSPPRGVGLIALEHRGDPVPTLDGARNPDRPGQVTIGFSDGLGSPLAAHGIGHYVQGAHSADTSPHPSVSQALTGIRPFVAPPLGSSRAGTSSTPAITAWLISRADE